MTIPDEIINFTQFSDMQTINDVLTTFSTQPQTCEHFFQLTCIKNQPAAAKHILDYMVQNNMQLDIPGSIKLAMKYSSIEIIQLLLSSNFDLTTDKLPLLKMAISYKNNQLIYSLLNNFHYNASEMDELYQDAVQKLNPAILLYLKELNPHVAMPIDRINDELAMCDEEYYDFSTKTVDRIVDLIKLGGNPNHLNSSANVLSMIANQEFENTAKLLLHGVNVIPTQDTIEWTLQQYGVNLESLIVGIEELKNYMAQHHPQHNFTINDENLQYFEY